MKVSLVSALGMSSPINWAADLVALLAACPVMWDAGEYGVPIWTFKTEYLQDLIKNLLKVSKVIHIENMAVTSIMWVFQGLHTCKGWSPNCYGIGVDVALVVEALHFFCQIASAWSIMTTVSEVHNVNIWSSTAIWKSTCWSEQRVTGTLGGISGVSGPPSVLDTFNGIEDVTSVSVAVKAELKVDVVTVGHHSHSKLIAEFLWDTRQKVSHFVKNRWTNTSRSINNEQNMSCGSIRAGLAASPLMDGIHSCVNVKGLHWNRWIQNLLLWRSDECDFLFLLQRAFPCRMSIRVGMKDTCICLQIILYYNHTQWGCIR